MLTISVLGPVEVRRDGEVVGVPGGKSSELLVRLALEAGVVVRTDRLVDDLWALDAVRTSRNTLQSKVVRLRRALGEPAVIVSGDGGYSLAVDRSAVDALAVLDDATRAAGLLDAGDHRGAVDVCDGALARFRGELLPGAEDGEWATPHRTRLDEARLRLLETRFAALAATGASAELVGELEAAVAAYPFQEGLWAQLVTALYRSGRQADALAAYQRVRDRLADELGLDPGPQLRDLERRILVHDTTLAGDRRDAPVGAGAAPAAGNLPSMATELVGRDAELVALGDLLASERLVVIIGPGGVGKTALAIAAARLTSRPGGVWLARLEAAGTPLDVLDTVVAALGIAGAVGGEAALAERLRGTEALLVLDNCEHVLDAAAELAERLLDAAPGITILCTSQVPLDIDGEARFELAPLDLDDAAELFTRRAVAPRAGAPIDGDGRAAVYELCRSLDGLPLAIELAAARTRTLSVQEITRRLDDRFGVLSDPTSRRPERRRALKATIGWSYDLLFPDDQRGLWALATFTGGAPLPAVEFVLGALDVPATAAIDVIGRLEGRSLVTVDEGSDPSRYRLLDSIRAFAVEAMADAGLTDVAVDAHSRWFADEAGRSTAGVRSAEQARHLAFARTERPNIDAALTWCLVHEPGRALRLVDGFGWAWVVLGDIRAAGRIAAALDAAGPGAPAAQRAEALLLMAWLEPSTGDLDRARRQIAEAEALAVAVDDVDLHARARYFAAYVASHEADFDLAMTLTDESRARYGDRDRPWDVVASWLLTARAAILAGDRRRSIEACSEVERRLQTIDDPWLHVRRDATLGELARTELRFDDAVRYATRAAETSGRLGFLAMEAYHLANLGRARWLAGDDGGPATLELALARADANGDVRLAALVRVHLGRVLRALGRLDEARAALDASSAWNVAAGGGEQAALGEVVRAAMDAADGVPGAADRLEEILAAARLVDDAPVEVLALDALALAAARAGHAARARELAEESDRRMPAAAHTIADRDRPDRAALRAR